MINCTIHLNAQLKINSNENVEFETTSLYLKGLVGSQLCSLLLVANSFFSFSNLSVMSLNRSRVKDA